GAEGRVQGLPGRGEPRRLPRDRRRPVLKPEVEMTIENTATGRHHVVVVGGGFGGLNVTRELADADVDITVVDRTNHHLFQPLLYQVAAGILSPGLIAPALRGILREQRNVGTILADVRELDLAGKV